MSAPYLVHTSPIKPLTLIISALELSAAHASRSSRALGSPVPDQPHGRLDEGCSANGFPYSAFSPDSSNESESGEMETTKYQLDAGRRRTRSAPAHISSSWRRKPSYIPPELTYRSTKSNDLLQRWKSQRHKGNKCEKPSDRCSIVRHGITLIS